MAKQYLKAIVKREAGKVSVVASTALTDRQGESIDQAGWNLLNFIKNPVMLWAHNYNELPLGKWSNVKVENGQLTMDANFASPEANPKAENVRLLVEEGIQKTVSVGFIPEERNGNIITKAELLEVSFVPVPANPEALAFAMSKGFSENMFEKAQNETEADICDVNSPSYDADKCSALKDKEKICCIDCGVELTDETKKERKTDKEDVIELVCEACLAKEKANTKPAICEPDSPDYDPQACGAIFCDPQSPDYNQDFCNLMKGLEKQITVKVGRVLSEKNRGLIQDSISQFENTISILRELLTATNAADNGVEKVLPTGEVGQRSEADNALLVEDVVKDVLQWRRQIRDNKTQDEGVLISINKFLAQIAEKSGQKD